MVHTDGPAQDSVAEDTSCLAGVGLVGLGTVGCGWAAAYLAKGIPVSATDPSADAAARCADVLARAWPAMRDLGLTSLTEPPLDRLRVVPDIAAAVVGCAIVHENAPERLDVKREIYAAIEAAGRDDALIASSTGGIPPSVLAEGLRLPQRFLVLHPFNPPHLVPLIEVIGCQHTDAAVLSRATSLMRRLGKHPIRIDREAPGFLTNRLQFALLREAVHCLAEGIAEPQAIEDAVRFGLGPRWAVMGSLTTLTLSGGEDGMPAVMERFGAAIETWWSALGAPTLTPDVRERLIAAGRAVTQGRPLADWPSWRDERLVAVLRASGATSCDPP